MRHFVCAAALALLPALTVVHAQDKVLATPPSITTEGVPPIPQSIADGLARYAQFRQAQLMAWHPTKRQIVITTNLGAVNQLYSIDGPLRYRRQLTWPERGMPAFSNVAFDPADPNTLLFQFDPGGELRSLYRHDLASGETTLLTSSRTRYQHVFARGGKWVAFDSAERNGRDRDLYVMLVSDPATKRRVIEAEGAWSPQDWSPDGNTILVTEVFANAETYLWTVDVKTGERKAITPRGGEKAAWFNPRFSSDGRKVYAISDRLDGDFRVWRCDLADCKWTAVTPDGMVVDALGGVHGSAGFELSSDGAQLAVVVDKGSSTEIQVIDIATMKPRTFASVPRGLVSQLRWRPGSREVGFTLGSIKAQGDVYSLDTALGTLTRWTSSEASFNPDVLPAPEVVEWKSFDGTMISGVLYRPSTKFTGPRPVMINIHGGPDDRERVRWQGRSNYFLNEMGVAIIFPNVRGSVGFGRKFQQMDDGRAREGAVKDIGALLDWVATQPDLDRNRVLLLGASYGGWLAVESAIYYNDRIRGVIEGAGITDFVTYLENTDAARQSNRRVEFGDERDPQTREFLKSLSPTTRAAELKKPIFILHPGKDIRVPVAQARELRDAVKKNNGTLWYAEFPDADHNFPNTAANNDWMLASWIAFIRAYLVN